MVECPKCKAQCFSKEELDMHDVLSHLAEDVRTIEGYTVINFKKEEHAQKYILSIGNGKLEWEGSGWYVYSGCKGHSLLTLDSFIRIIESDALGTISKMTSLRLRMAK